MLSLLLAILSLPYLFRIGAVFLFAIAQKNVPLHRKMCHCTEKCAIDQA